MLTWRIMTRILKCLHAALGVAALMAGVAAAELPTVGIDEIPPWVIEHLPDLQGEPSSESTRSDIDELLLDYQEHLVLGHSFTHRCMRLVNQEGVSNGSDIIVRFDPAYQELSFHFIRVYRDGQVIDKLADHEIHSYQREQQMEWGLYDGMITSVVNLRDMRPGDCLEYAYTRSGVNPLLEGHVTQGFNQCFASPIQGLYIRVIVDPDLRVWEHEENSAEPLTRSKKGEFVEYNWQGWEIPGQMREGNVPQWYDPRPSVELTSFMDWAAVVDWARPLYQLEADDLVVLQEQMPADLAQGSKEERLQKCVRLVQDEVRYLGREEGLWAFQPHKPALCMEQRFGDCKDKSLLLVGLLKLLDVEAYPVLVNSVQRERVSSDAPSPLAFDHCVVGFEFEGKTHFVDVTRSQQGGGVLGLYFSDFGKGLPIHEEGTGLVDLPKPNLPRIEVEELFDVEGNSSGDARFSIETSFFGYQADMQRALFARDSLEEISRSYVTFYSNLYPGIELAAPMRVNDLGRDARENRLEVIESYLIRDFWQPTDEDSGLFYIEFKPLELAAYLDLASSPARTMPYAIGSTIDYRIHTEVRLPEGRDSDFDPIEIREEGVRFNHEIRSDGLSIHIDFGYRREIGDVSPAGTPAFLRAHEKMRQQLPSSFYGTQIFGTQESDVFWINPLIFILFSVGLLGGGVLAFMVNRRYDPVPEEYTGSPIQARRIGGWLIIPAIGVILNPVTRLGTSLLNFESIALLAFRTDAPVSARFWKELVAIEFLGNMVLFVVSILIAIQFFSRRSSFPQLFIAFLVAGALFQTLDSIAAAVFLEAVTDADSARTAVGAWISVAIWVPYFTRSVRVKETFLFRRHSAGSGSLPAKAGIRAHATSHDSTDDHD